MATDYDAPRKTEEDQSEESIEELKARRHDKNSGKVDEDEAEAAEAFELPGADLSHEELAVAHREPSPEHRVDDAPFQAPAGEGSVPALGRERVRVDRPDRLGIEHHEVRAAPGLQRAAVAPAAATPAGLRPAQG